MLQLFESPELHDFLQEGEILLPEVAQALEYASQIVQDDPALVEPLMRLIAIVSPATGDPLRVALRNKVLDSLVGMTDHGRRARQELLGESEPVSQTTSSVS